MSPDDGLLSVAAHDIRSPLGVIRGYLRMLAQDPDRLSSEQQATVASMERSAEQITKIVDDLSLLAELSRGTLDLTPAPVPVEALVEPLAGGDGDGPVVRVDGTSGEFLVAVDPSRMRQALHSLVRSVAATLPPHEGLELRHQPDPSRSDRVVILVGGAKAISALAPAAASSSEASGAPRTIREAAARGLVEAQGGAIAYVKPGVLEVRLPRAAAAKA